jgi:hypothetical protein
MPCDLDTLLLIELLEPCVFTTGAAPDATNRTTEFLSVEEWTPKRRISSHKNGFRFQVSGCGAAHVRNLKLET